MPTPERSSPPGVLPRVPPADPDFDLRPFLDALAGVFGGGANVVMQLSWPEIGHGVYESRVDTGKVFLHPWKRARTTGTYLSVALIGSEQDRTVFRDAVNTAHAHVHSTASSPVDYNAFDPDLQLWVAACLFFGPYDYYCRVYGKPAPATAEAFYRHGARLATTLQVSAERWPATLTDFWAYWEEGQRRIRIDPAVRQYLLDVLEVRFLPFPLPLLLARPLRWLNTGFLPERFRAAMGLRWTARDEARLSRVLSVVRIVHRFVPGVARRFPIYVNLWDMRLRHRMGRPLV